MTPFALLRRLAPAFAPAGPGASEARTLTVFTAASLAGAVEDVARAFERDHPGVRVRLNIAGSNQLAAQLELGAAADVFVAADERWAAALHARGLLAAPPVAFAGNRLVAIVPRANRAQVRGLADLARPGLKLVLAGEAVPAGRYAREALGRLSRPERFGPGYAPRVLANLVSEEENVKAVVGKVLLGEADAGICYVSDVRLAVARAVTVLEIPEDANPPTTCFIGIVKHAPHPLVAREFVAAVLGEPGRRALARNRLGPPPRGRP